jgi:hypothetical protein
MNFSDCAFQGIAAGDCSREPVYKDNLGFMIFFVLAQNFSLL